MSVYFYYGELSDYTFTEGDVSCESQYPITNLNYLDANVPASLNDYDTETYGTTGYKYLKLAVVDAGAGNTITASSFALEVESLRVQIDQEVAVGTAKFDKVIYSIRYSDDNSTYTNAADILDDSSNISSDTNYDETLTDIYTGTFTEASHRYWAIFVGIRITVTGDIDWDIDGEINNLYIGDYLTLPSPELDRQELEHDVEVQTAYSGKRVAVEKQPQRKIWYYDYTNLTDTQKDNNIDFDLVSGQGLIPVYFENVEASTQIVDPTFVRVTNKITNITNAVESTAISQTIEEEL